MRACISIWKKLITYLLQNATILLPICCNWAYLLNLARKWLEVAHVTPLDIHQPLYKVSLLCCTLQKIDWLTSNHLNQFFSFNSYEKYCFPLLYYSFSSTTRKHRSHWSIISYLLWDNFLSDALFKKILFRFVSSRIFCPL